MVNCNNIASMPVLTFNINGNAFTLPASAYVRQVSPAFHNPRSSLVSGRVLTRLMLSVLSSLITTAAALVSARAARACGSWVMSSLGSTTPSSTGRTTPSVWPRLCEKHTRWRESINVSGDNDMSVIRCYNNMLLWWQSSKTIIKKKICSGDCVVLKSFILSCFMEITWISCTNAQKFTFSTINYFYSNK